MELNDKIKKFMWDKTKGLVRLDLADIDAIINLVRDHSARAIFYKWSNQKNTYIVERTSQISDRQLHETLAEYGGKPPIHEFGMYELYNSAGEKQGTIYTINYGLF